jgi:hypothetical protein
MADDALSIYGDTLSSLGQSAAHMQSRQGTRAPGTDPRTQLRRCSFPTAAEKLSTPPPPTRSEHISKKKKTRSEQDASGENGGDRAGTLGRASIRNKTNRKEKNKTRLERREEGNKTRGLYEAFPERFDSFVPSCELSIDLEGRKESIKSKKKIKCWRLHGYGCVPCIDLPTQSASSSFRFAAGPLACTLRLFSSAGADAPDARPRRP